MAKNSDIIRQCYIIFTDAVEKYQDNWMCDKTGVRVISARYFDILLTLPACLVRPSIVPSLAMLLNVEPRMLWVLIHQLQMSCPYDSGQRRNVSFFYRQVAGKPLAAPSGPNDYKDVHVRVWPMRLSTVDKRNHCLFTICYNYNNQHQSHGEINTITVAIAMYATTTMATGTTVKATSSAVMVMPSMTTVTSRYQLLLK
jgi:hypothetical protein